MNERIRELWHRAAVSTAACPSGANNSWATQVNFMNKFAELIAKDCAQIADTTKPYQTSDLILKHFGLEE